jgi:hypothetical protein
MVDQGGDTPVLAQRVGDAERDMCIGLLTDHHVSGRLSADELDQRHRAALCAVTRDDLVSLLRDLPLATERLGHEDGRTSTPDVPPRRPRPWPRLAWALPPCTVVGAAALMSNYRTDLLDREDAFVAALAVGAAGVASQWWASLVNRRGR